MTQKKIDILAISGSLRKSSSNRNILLAAAELAPEIMNFTFYEDMEELPPFNPDKGEGTAEVIAFKRRVKEADGVVICTPEYAFGVPGALKNALDWLVSSGELNEKPVVAISASPLVTGGDKALSSLLLTLKALGTNTVSSPSGAPTRAAGGPSDKSSLSIPAVSKKINEKGELTDIHTRHEIRLLMEALAYSIFK